ncbi:MAG: hypothetical protein LBM25_01430 [Bacteroidales bacterium]|jgi:hypothetical protein|nr:hypothetical protein [Bacteroidales bacterium]
MTNKIDKNIKKITFLLLIVCIITSKMAFSQEEKDRKVQFKFDLNFGTSLFDNSNNFSVFAANEGHRSFASAIFGLKWKRQGIDLCLDGYAGNTIYFSGIRENNYLCNVKLNLVDYINITDNFFISSMIGAGLLISDPTLELNYKLYDLDKRLGISANLGLAVYYQFNKNFIINLKVNCFVGRLKKVNLPKEFSTYKNYMNSNVIAATDISLGWSLMI